VVGDIDVGSMDDDELFAQLKKFGVEMGPIVGKKRYPVCKVVRHNSEYDAIKV